jgi:DNA-binding CsgD family transcriptional regulator/pimeloyl-ACP methyl ester carboxylesterase
MPPISVRFNIRSSLAFIDRLRGGRAFTAFDPRGYGLSGPMLGEPRVECWAEDLRAVVDATAERVHLISFSSTAYFAALFAREHPERVASIIFRSPTIAGLMGREPRAHSGAFCQLMEADFSLALNLLLHQAFAIDPAEPIAEYVAGYEAGFKRDLYRKLVHSELHRTARLEDYLRGVEVPVLVWGDRGDETGLAAAAAMVPNARMAVIPRIQESASKGGAIGPTINDFLAQAERGERAWASPNNHASLSPRETDVLRLVAAGRTNAEVASGLALSVRTVERHLENIYRETGAANRTAASAWAIRNGLA